MLGSTTPRTDRTVEFERVPSAATVSIPTTTPSGWSPTIGPQSMQTQSQLPSSRRTTAIGPECGLRPMRRTSPVVRSASDAAGPPWTRSAEGVGGEPGMKCFGSGEPAGGTAGLDGADDGEADGASDAGDVVAGALGGSLPTFELG